MKHLRPARRAGTRRPDEEGALLAGLTRWHPPADVSGTSGELLSLSGESRLYKGTIGLVREGAPALPVEVTRSPTSRSSRGRRSPS